MNKEATIDDVSDTAYWVAYFRAKENEHAKPLFRDPFAKMLIGNRGKALAEATPEVSRYVEWSVLSRTVIIDRFIEQAVKEGVDAVINLGAGLDARPYRMNLPKNLRWVEVDYLNIVEHKNTKLQAQVPQCDLIRVALDLTNAEERSDFFANIVADAKSVLILTEGVIPYLSPSDVSALAKDLLEQQRFTYWVMEYMHQKIYRYLQDSSVRTKLKNAPFKFFPEDW